MAVLGMVILIRVADQSVTTNYQIPWWAVAIAFGLVDWQAIHLPTRRSSHTITLNEVPLAVGLAFLSPPMLLAARLIGSGIPLIFIRKQRPDRLVFNVSLSVLETASAATVFHGLRAGTTLTDPRAWIALFVAGVVAAGISVLAVGGAIALHDAERSLRARSREIGIGLFISGAASVLGVLWTVATWSDVRVSVLIALALVPMFFALRRFELLGRRHGELEIVFELTKDLETCVSLADVGKQAIAHVAELTRPSAALLLFQDHEPMVYTTELDERVSPVANWPELARMHLGRRDEPTCDCGGDALGKVWRGASSYPVIAGDGQVGLMVVRPRRAPGGELTTRDHRTLTAVASQISSAVTRIAALRRLELEVEEKRDLIRSKDQLIASVSHELRTPLTAILGFAEVLAEDGLEFSPEDKDQATQFIAAEARDLGNIVEDLLTAARADLNTLEVQRKPIAIRAAVQQASAALGERLDVTINGEDLIVLADPPRVRQVLRNLFTNAAKYGGRNVEVELADEGDLVAVMVRDDGDGVPETGAERIFDPYESAHTEPSQPNSLGLGLTISRTLARLMDGDLTYRRVDGWTEFRLELPAVHN
jgi:signal transduction histidine kinase